MLAPVGLLLAAHFADDGLLLLPREESGKFRRSPQKGDAIDGGLRRAFAVQVFAQHPDVVLDFGSRAVILRGRANRDRSKRGSIKIRIVGFPRLIAEPQPRPRACFDSRGLLFGPHVIQRPARVVAEPAALRVVAGKDQRIENGFRPARFDSLVRAAVRVAIERGDFLPKAYALGDIVQQSTFVEGRSIFGKFLTKRRSGERVRQRRVARHAKSFVIARGFWPCLPPAFPLIEVSGGSPLIPGVHTFAFRWIEVSRYSLRGF